MSIVGNKVQFREGTKAEYESLQEKDPATFYYTSDTNEVFIGSNQLGSVWHEVGSTPQPAVTEFTIDAQADLEKHWSSYSVYGGFDYALNLTLGDVWKCEFTYQGQTQELPDLTVIKCSDASITGALADNLCLADDSLGVIIDKAESAFDGNDMWQPVYNENKTAMDIMGVTSEGQILPVTLKFTKIAQ